MGFSFSPFGLCCDFCGESKPEYNVIKIPCPYGFCQAWACCKYCKAEKRHLTSSCTNDNKSHKEICKSLAKDFDEKQHEKAELIANGQYVRVAAESIDNEMVKVTFRGIGKDKVYVMHEMTYHKIPTQNNAIVADYEKLGILEMLS